MKTRKPSSRKPERRGSGGALPGLVCIPCQETMLTASVVALEKLVLPAGSARSKLRGDDAAAPKRNHGIGQLLENPSWRWVCFIDSDMMPAPDAVMRLLALRAPVAAALMFARRPPFCHELGRASGEVDLTRGPFEVDWAGAGCLLVRRQVIEALSAPWFEYPDTVGRRNDDLVFCEKVRRAGFKIVVDPSVVVGHLGRIEIDLATASAFWRAWGLEVEGVNGKRVAMVGPDSLRELVTAPR